MCRQQLRQQATVAEGSRENALSYSKNQNMCERIKGLLQRRHGPICSPVGYHDSLCSTCDECASCYQVCDSALECFQILSKCCHGSSNLVTPLPCRFLSACPAVYWYAASGVKPQGSQWIWGYFLAYFCLGNVLFTLFYPWT